VNLIIRASVLSASGLLFLAGASRIVTSTPGLDISPVGRQCITERRVYCAPDMTSCHTERDFYWLAAEAGACPAVVDTISHDVPPTPVFKCTDDAGIWYSWAPCDEEPDPIDA
jgi:hypothetical protein